MHDRNHLIASAASTLEILEVLGNAGVPLSLGAIAQASGRPKASAHRMLATLVNTDYVIRDSSGHYRLSLKSWRVGSSALRNLDVVKLATPWIERLVAATDETVHLAVLDPSGGVVYVAKLESLRSIRVQTQIGQVGPSWCTATGRCLLAFNAQAADRVLAQPLEQRTARTVVDPRRIRTLLAEVASKGYAMTRAENHPEMGGVAAPIRDHSGAVIAACGVAIPAFRMDRALVERCIPEVMRAADAISEALGHQHPSHPKLRYGT